MTNPINPSVAGVERDEPLEWFLKVVASGGKDGVPAGDAWSFLNAFCDDRGEQTDTYNLSESKGLTETWHSGFGDGVATCKITEAGRAYLEALATPSTAPEGGDWRTVPVAEAMFALNLLADWLTRVQNESDDTDAEKALLCLSGDAVADIAKRLAAAPQPKPDERLAKAMEALNQLKTHHEMLIRLAGAKPLYEFKDGKRVRCSLSSALKIESAAAIEAIDEALRYLEGK